MITSKMYSLLVNQNVITNYHYFH